MCGVFGIIFESDQQNLGDYLIKAAQKLVYRGYDSAGFASFSSTGATKLSKGPGKLDEVIKQYDIKNFTGTRAIVQLRWATFGEPNEVNSQPHYDSDGDIIGAHNGNIVNTNELISQFESEGMTVRGCNDGEMVVHAFEKFYNQNPDQLQAMIKAQSILKWDYAFIVGHQDTHQLLAVKMGSSLYMGIGDGFICCSSDLASVLQFTKEIVALKDGEIVIYDHKNYQIYDLFSGEKIYRKQETSTISIEEAKLEGYPHYMLKEINEQPAKSKELLELMSQSSPEQETFINILQQSRRVWFVASGTSYHAAVIGAHYFSQLANIAVQPVIAGQFNEIYGHLVGPNDTLLCISQSGETKDLINAMNPLIQRNTGQLLSMVNVVGSSVATKSISSLNIAAGLETSVPATKSFINQILLLLILAVEIGCRNNVKKALEVKPELYKIPTLIRETIASTQTPCEEIADQHLIRAIDLYCLGYGLNFGTALEGSLKIKEVYYKHCEGMYSSEFKHGPLSIIQEGYPILFPAAPEESYMVISHINEIRVRKGYVVVISSKNEGYTKAANRCIEVPPSHYMLTPFANTVALQLIAYYASVKSGYDPDFPRNISKTLTVD
jgi:glutamine---fructose-6-phosphate transaminase (isomerizing)